MACPAGVTGQSPSRCWQGRLGRAHPPSPREAVNTVGDFSNNAVGNMGPARWSAAHFAVSGETTQTISIR